jgi:hypothetical protein
MAIYLETHQILGEALVFQWYSLSQQCRSFKSILFFGCRMPEKQLSPKHRNLDHYCNSNAQSAVIT